LISRRVSGPFSRHFEEIYAVSERAPESEPNRDGQP
jgi:hypothetical protein